MNLIVGQLVKCENLSTSLGMILSIKFDNQLNRQHCTILWNDGRLTNSWMNIIPI